MEDYNHHRAGDLIHDLLHHLQNNPNPDPNHIKFATLILSSKMTPLTTSLSTESAMANSIKTHLAKQGKLSKALSFDDLFTRFISNSGPGSIHNKHSVLYLLKLLSENSINSVNGINKPSFNNSTHGLTELRNYSNRRLTNGGVLSVLKCGENVRETACKEFVTLVDEENDLSEEVLVGEVLCVCYGNDGSYVKFDESVDGYVLLDCVKATKGTRVMVRKLCELGWLFRKVDGYVCENVEGEGGVVVKAFCNALGDELLEYCKLLKVFRSRVTSLSLRRLAVWFVEPMVKMRRMAVLVDSCKGLKGGAVAGVIHLHAQHGDTLLRDLMQRLLHKVSTPLFEMVRSWVLKGELQDLYSEFFVSEQSVKPGYLWREGYQINHLMLPSFISKSLANRILRTGKSINFLKVCCEDNSWVDSTTEANELESLVTEAAKRIDKHLMNVIVKNYKFKEHCLAIKRYILLGQGDFVQYLMEIIGPVLSEPASYISLIQLSGLLEKAILSSSAQFDDRDILDRLKVKMMPHGDKDSGWDVFSLDYNARVPLNTIFTETAMGSYLRIFKFLWKIRKVEHAVLGAWKTMKPNLITSDFFTKLPKAVRSQIVLTSRRCQVFWDEINHFVINLQSYIMYEVLEVSWSKFCNELDSAKDLDVLIAAHDKYLNTIVEKALLGGNSEALYKTLLMLFDVIQRFCSVADRLYEGIYEFRTRNTENKKKAGKKSKSKGLETDPWLNEGRKAVTQRAGEFLSNIGQDLTEVSNEYSSILKGFMSQLPMQQHIDLKFLMFRLDFTEFYSLAH